jgi:GT2 family glycosyltransferase
VSPCPFSAHDVMKQPSAASEVAFRKRLGSIPVPRVSVEGKFLARGSQRLRVCGVTYGPFACGSDDQPFPTPWRVEDDFARMRAAGINAIRTYHVPPDWLLELAAESEIAVYLDVPWPKHLCFLDSLAAQAEARHSVRRAAEHGRRHASILAYSIGNEIPASVVRWHGARRVERFLAELNDVAKQADPSVLTTYANFPPTEYLDLSFLDFATFNVYLHESETFRRYLLRLQNLVGERPLLIGELGMDTLRHGEWQQSRLLCGHAREALMTGLAGLFVFSWTDDWHTGGHQIDDWAFGITRADRSPKASYHALGEIFRLDPPKLLKATPRVSVVVCTYNGGSTLEQCLCSLRMLDYPDYEVIVVDDGSTDDTGEILARFPDMQAVRQSNHGLSFARNVGLRLATGAVVAYTDSDCFADPDWLTLLVEQLEHSGAAAVGGPNLTPQDGWLAGCVAASPGQPTHVLESDQVAEHVPGCNMAFRREVLESINGFDSQFKKAGDDVDVCWRLQQAGYWISFAPGAVVWHHRRQTVRTYLRQQSGYGEAEALLRFKHPDKFNGRGDGKWRGVMYGDSLRGLRLGAPMIYQGTFGSGLFQCLYQPRPAHWLMLPSTLEWHVAAAILGLAGLLWPESLVAAAGMLGLSLVVAALLAWQARLAPGQGGLRARCVVAILSYLQPLLRSWARYRTRLLAHCPPRDDPALERLVGPPLALRGRRCVAYWSENGIDRTELVGLVIAYLNENRWGRAIDSGWSRWDVDVYCRPWTIVRVRTGQEEHGGTRRLLRVSFQLRPAAYSVALGAVGLLEWVGAGVFQSWFLLGGAGVTFLLWGWIWWWARRRANRVVAIFDLMGQALGLIRCEPAPTAAGPGAAETQRLTAVTVVASAQQGTRPVCEAKVAISQPAADQQQEARP